MTLEQHPRVVEIPEPAIDGRVERYEGETHARALEIAVVKPLSSQIRDLLGNRRQRSLGEVHRAVEVGIVVPPCALQFTGDPQRMPASRRLGDGIPRKDAPKAAQA
jgi:hypothetical protein